jgi:hypothetical protein
MAAEGLQIVRELADGSLEWQEPLGAPGEDRCVTLADLDVRAALGATAFELTAAGDWIAAVAGPIP